MFIRKIFESTLSEMPFPGLWGEISEGRDFGERFLWGEITEF